MKLKRFLYTATAILLAISLTACGNGDDSDEGAAFFKLENSPAALFTKPDDEIVGRYNEEYTVNFTPSADYGEIMPFIGKYLTYTLTTKEGEQTVTSPVYGLCTEDGRVIVDPIYLGAERYELDDGTCFYQLYIDSGIKGRNGRRIAVAHNGSWMIDLGQDTVFSGLSGDGMMAFERTKAVTKEKTNYFYDLYDYNGNKAFTYEPVQNNNDKASSTISTFADGLAAINQTQSSGDGAADVTSAYYIDKAGKMVIGDLSFAGDFAGGFAVVADKDGLYGVMNTKGEYLIKPAFMSIDYNVELGLFACEGDGMYQIYNTNNESIKTIFCKNSDVRVFGADKLIFEKTSRTTNKSEFFFLESEEPFIYSGTGQFPTEYIGSGLYLCDYSGVGYFFNENGESIVTCENFGGIVANDGSYIVAHTKRKDKLIFIDILAKKILQTVEADYSDGIADKGIFAVKSGEKYAVYNAVSGQYAQSDCEYAEILRSSQKQFISIVKDGSITLYDDAFNIIMKSAAGGANV